MEVGFSEFDRLTESQTPRFDVPPPCAEEEFDSFCASLALCGRHALELLREIEERAATHSPVDTSDNYEEAESDTDSSLSEQALVPADKHSSSGNDAAFSDDQSGGSDAD